MLGDALLSMAFQNFANPQSTSSATNNNSGRATSHSIVLNGNGEIGFLVDPASVSALFGDFEDTGMPDTLTPEELKSTLSKRQ